MTLAADQDFALTTEHGIIRARPKNPNATSAFKVLQVTVSRAVEQLPDAPAVSIEVDGVIGPTIALAVQVIAQRLASTKHQGLTQLGGLQPEEAIPTIAGHAMEVAGYIDTVMREDPTALVNPQVIPEPPDPIAQLKALFTPRRIAAALGTIVGLAGFAFAAAATDRRGLGLADRSHMLPPSDGTDEFEDEGHGEDDEDPMSDVDTEGAIDVEAVEVPSRAA